LEVKTITLKIAQQCLVETFAEDGHVTVGKQVGHQPLPHEFASMLAELFSGNPPGLSQPAHSTGQLWSMEQLKFGQIQTK